MLYICKTSVQNQSDVDKLAPFLDQLVRRGGEWNFDLEDCDRILRVNSSALKTEKVVELLEREGFSCEEL